MFIHYVLTHCNDIVYNVIKDKGRSPKKFNYHVHTKCTYRRKNMETIQITVNFTFDNLFSVLSERACDTLRVIASHHKINKFMALARELGYRELSIKEWESILDNNITTRDKAEAVSKVLTLSDFEALLLTEETELYYNLDIPLDENHEPLPYEEA